MNKKIGVCCVFDHRNYGSMLQTLATIEKLEQMGYDYEIIHYTKKLTLDLLLRSLDRIPEEIKTRVHSMNKNKKMDTYPEIKDSIKIRNSILIILESLDLQKYLSRIILLKNFKLQRKITVQFWLE